jgi:uncharacterized protein (DUF952 family)
VPLIYHLAREAEWQKGLALGTYEGSADDRRDGFLHFSTGGQVVVSAARHRAGERDVRLVAIDPAELGDALRWEESRGGALFPHLYAALDPRLVAWTQILPLGDDGAHVFPPLD